MKTGKVTAKVNLELPAEIVGVFHKGELVTFKLFINGVEANASSLPDYIQEKAHGILATQYREKGVDQHG